VDLDFLGDRNISPEDKDKIFIGGDALRRPGNLISAIADGRTAAIKMITTVRGPLPGVNPAATHPVLNVFQEKAARREYGSPALEQAAAKRRNFKVYRETFSEESAKKEASRCLACDLLCNVCVSVCPNRANISYRIQPVEYRLQRAVKQNSGIAITGDGHFKVEQLFQVLHVADLCNHCGNCRTFCPTNGSPYLDKPRVCLSEESFAGEDNAYFFGRSSGKLYIKSKFNGQEATLFAADKEFLFRAKGVTAELDKKSFSINKIEFTSLHIVEAHFRHAAAMSILLRHCPAYLQADF